MDQYIKLLYKTKRLAKEACQLQLCMSTRRESTRSPSFQVNGGIRAKGRYGNPTMTKALLNIDDEIRLKRVLEDLEKCKELVKARIQRSDNPLMLQSLYLRIVCDQNWEEISEAIGGIYTARGLKRSARKMEQRCSDDACKKYLKKAV